MSEPIPAENESAIKLWSHTVIELFKDGIDELEIDYEKKNGDAGKLLITIEDISNYK